MTPEQARRYRRMRDLDTGRFDHVGAARCTARAEQPYPWAQRVRHDHDCRLPDGHDDVWHRCRCNKNWRTPQ